MCHVYVAFLIFNLRSNNISTFSHDITRLLSDKTITYNRE